MAELKTKTICPNGILKCLQCKNYSVITMAYKVRDPIFKQNENYKINVILGI